MEKVRAAVVLSARWLRAGKGTAAVVPQFTLDRLTGWATSDAPATIANATAQAFPVASRPATLTSQDFPRLVSAALQPRSARFEQVVTEDVRPWFLTYAHPSCLPDPRHLAVLGLRSFSELLWAGPREHSPGIRRTSARRPPDKRSACLLVLRSPRSPTHHQGGRALRW